MKTEALNKQGQTLAPYASPSVVVIEVAVQSVLCESGTGFNFDGGRDTVGPGSDDVWN